MAENFSLKNIFSEEKKYIKAYNLYEAGCVNITRVSDFWRNDKEITGKIYDREKSYKAKITVSRKDMVGFCCDCNDFIRDKVVCAHIGALYLAYSGRYSEEEKVIYTSLETRRIVNGYLKKKHNDSKLSKGKQVLFSMSVESFNHDLTITTGVFVGDKLYKIKNIYEFVERIEEKAYYEYGKNNGFTHSIDAFENESAMYVRYIQSMIRMEERLCKVLGTSKVLLKDNHKLVLCGREVDSFIEQFKDKVIMFDNKKHNIIWKNPDIYVKIKKEGHSGYAVYIENIKGYIEGADSLYIYDAKNIYVPDREFVDSMGIFIRNICDAGEKVLFINQKDMSSFCNGVLITLMENCIVDMPDDLLMTYKPWELTNEFNIRKDRDNLYVNVTSMYNDENFDIYTGVCANKNVCRDYNKEYAVRMFFEEYNSYRMPNGELKITGYDNIYEFLDKGVYRLSQYGIVNLSDEVKNISLVNDMKLTANVSVNDQWLDLKIDTESYTEKELDIIINAYRQKENYTLLNPNTIINLSGDGFKTIGKLSYDLNVTANDIISRNIFVPRYRAMYLDYGLTLEDKGYDSDERFKALISKIQNIENNEYEIPQELRDVLRDYQRVGYKWLKTMDVCGFGGILADDMGLGKTIQIIALLQDEYKDKVKSKKSLIVVPASLIYNWENEINRFAPMLKVMSVIGAKSERISLINDENADILITSYELLKRDIEEYSKMSFRYQILDEAQNIKNYTTANAKAVKRIQAETKYALTGTPIENRLSELWSIFDYVMPGFLYSNKIFKDKFEVPIVKEQEVEIKDSFVKLISPFILRRVKKDVLKELPDKQEYNLYAKMEGEQHKLYTANAIRLKEELINKDDTYYMSNKIKFLAQITRLRQICCDPSLCYEDYEDESAKLEMCIDLIKNSIEGGHKILLFSQFTSMLQIIAKRLNDENISFYTLTGKTSIDERISLVNRFNKDDTQVFLMSLKVGGFGLNLTGADIVIHYDPWWNMAVQNQATDRAHRIGQDKSVSVYKLIAKDSIEENIYKLQLAKEQLGNDIVNGNNISLTNLSKEELLSILVG